LCYEPELIPDPLVVYTNIDLPNGSGISNGVELTIQLLIPDPVWNADSFASQYHNAGSGISVVAVGIDPL